MKIRKLKQKQILPSKRISYAIAKRAKLDPSKWVCISSEEGETYEQFKARLLKFFNLNEDLFSAGTIIADDICIS